MKRISSPGIFHFSFRVFFYLSWRNLFQIRWMRRGSRRSTSRFRYLDVWILGRYSKRTRKNWYLHLKNIYLPKTLDLKIWRTSIIYYLNFVDWRRNRAPRIHTKYYLEFYKILKIQFWKIWINIFQSTSSSTPSFVLEKRKGGVGTLPSYNVANDSTSLINIAIFKNSIKSYTLPCNFSSSMAPATYLFLWKESENFFLPCPRGIWKKTWENIRIEKKRVQIFPSDAETCTLHRQEKHWWRLSQNSPGFGGKKNT